MRAITVALGAWAFALGCGAPGPGATGDARPIAPVPRPVCSEGGGGAAVAVPALRATLADRWHEAWLASPAIADLDGDSQAEMVIPRGDQLIVWQSTGAIAWRASLPGRIWASPVVADLDPSRPGLEVAVAARAVIAAYDARGTLLPGFPVSWRDEMRALAAGDLDGDGDLELVAVTTTPLSAAGQRDIVFAVHHDGRVVAGFPPNTSGAAGCDAACYVTGGYDQTLAVGDVDNDGKADIFAPQDNAYMSLHSGSGRAFDAAAIFRNRTKFSGIRWMVDYALAQQGFANDENVDEQAHFTNTAPAIADLDGDGRAELIALGSIQNTAQNDRERGVGLFVANPDGTRPPAWQRPLRLPAYTSGLWDGEDNIVGITNQVAVADLDPDSPGPELVFAGFDQQLHAVSADGRVLWTAPYTGDASTWTAGVAIADLSADGRPELVLTTYGPNGGDLIVMAANGAELHRVPLGGRGAMPVPSLADVDGNGTVDIVVSLKDGEDRVRQVLVYEVAGSQPQCLLWPTGRGNLRRDGRLPRVHDRV